MNEIELKKAFIENSTSAAGVAKKIGLAPSTLYRKIHACSFDQNEIIAISKVLHLNDADIIRIFFAKKLTKTQVRKAQ